MVVTFDASQKDEGNSDHLYVGLAKKGRFADLDDFYHTPEVELHPNNQMEHDDDAEEWVRDRGDSSIHDDDGSSTGLIIGVIVILIMAIGGVICWLRSRKGNSQTFRSAADGRAASSFT